MKKAWKWIAAVVGIPALCVAVLWVDSYYRAVAAIRAEDERLARDIAAYRARKKPGLPVEPSLFWANLPGDTSGIEKRQRPLPCPTALFLKRERAQVDQGHSGHRNFYYSLLPEYYRHQSGSTSSDPDRPLTGDQVITAVSVIHALAQECGYDSRSLCHSLETKALRELRSTLPAGLPAAEIRRIAGELDRCLAARPTFEDTFDAEHLMDRAEVLRVLHLKADPSGMITRKPGWKEFFSWRILLVKALKQLDRQYEVLRPIAAGSHDGLDRATDLLLADRKERLTETSLIAEAVVRRWMDDEVQCVWILARLAAAIALYQAETGRDLERLEQLVPQYAPRIPVDPERGNPVQLADGILKIRLSTRQASVWDVRRK